MSALSVPSVASLATPSIPTLCQASYIPLKKNWVREYQELHLCLSSSSLSRHRGQNWIHAEALWVVPVAHVIMQYCGLVQLSPWLSPRRRSWLLASPLPTGLPQSLAYLDGVFRGRSVWWATPSFGAHGTSSPLGFLIGYLGRLKGRGLGGFSLCCRFPGSVSSSESSSLVLCVRPDP